MGKIGRNVARRIVETEAAEIVGFADVVSISPLAKLLEFDTTRGWFNGTVGYEGDAIVINGRKIPYFNVEKGLPDWRSVGADGVIEGSGKCESYAAAKKHLDAGAPKVLITAPYKDDADEKDIETIVLGVNDQVLATSTEKVFSNASCTTNALAPLLHVLEKKGYTIKWAYFWTTHSYTNDQRLHDAAHSDPYRMFAAAGNIIPTISGAGIATYRVLPQLKGKVDGEAERVPVPDGSVLNVIVELDKQISAKEANQLMKEAADTYMQGIIEYCEKQVPSSAVLGKSCSSMFMADLTRNVAGLSRLRLKSYYDNEWGYSSRVVDLAARL